MKDYFTDLSIQKEHVQEKESNLVNSATSIPLTADAAIVAGTVDITKECIRCFTEYAKCKEHEITERKRISAMLRAVQYQIDAQKEVYLRELEKNYEDRNRLYDMAEKTQQKALELGDKEMLQLCYNFILNVYTKPYGNNRQIPLLLGGSCPQL
ncbi:MAG: hypothetical protein PUC12_06090 [Clostridiales bacterium]|nr:hypothetical protein [Clostridiales bacterium]